MAIPNRVWKKLTNTKLKLSDLNPHLMCVLCGGYYIDATTIVECLHSFCRSCIVKHLEGSKYCPICEVQVHKTKPLINIRPDKTLQDIVYKLVPGLFANEMQNRRDFYQERPHYIKPDDSESAGEVSEFRKMLFANSENITFSLIYLEGPSPLHMDHTRYREVTSIQRELRYFRCPTAVTIAHLKKLLKAKYELRGNNYRVDMFLKEDTLNDEYSLLDISYIYLWNTKDNLSLTFKVFEGPAKRRRRRYFGGVDELPAHFTPLSILQSRLGILANSMAEDNMSEGRRHLRSDIEKKRKEIEARIEEERRLSERELRSHDEKKREKEKEKDKKNEVKKKDKDKHDEKKKDKNHEGKEKKKEGKSNDEKKKDGKNGEEKKKNPEEKKKKKEGRCQDEKRKEKDDKEDKEDKDEEKRMDKEAKEERNREKEMKKDGENKRKREGEPEGKRKREKREEIKENNIDKKERKEVKEDGREKTVTGEATSTSSEPDSTQTSTPTQPPVTTSSSASTTDQAQTSSSTEEGSATTSTTETASDSTSEPTSTTATENEQKTEEADMKEDETPTSSRENRATPPKDSGDTEIQLQISESGVMSTSPVLESGGDVVRTVEERGCGRVTRRSSITGATFRDEGLGNREMRKRRGSNGKSDDGSPNDPNQKVGLKSSKTYKTICRSANLWHPSISKEKLKPTAIKGKEQAKKPAKFFKLRGKTRSSGNPPSDEKPAHEDPVLKEVKEEEELPQHEVEKEEAQVEPEAAHVAIRDEGEEKRIEEEKRRIEEEEEKKQNEEEKRKLEEDNKMETTPTNNNSALKGDPKTFGPLDKDDKCSMIVGASAPDLPTNLKADPKTFGPLDKEDRCSTIVGANAPNLPTNLKGDPKTFEALDNDDKSSTIVGASAPDLPANLIGDPKTFGPLEKEDKCSMIVGASAPNLPTNLKGDANIFGPPDKEGNGSTIVGASAPDLPTNLKGGSKSFGAFEKEDKCSMIVGASAPNLPTNLKGDLKNFGSHDKEERCATIVGASAPNLLTNPFIPNTSQVFSCDGNYSKWAESKLDKSLLGKAVPGVGGLGAGLGVGSGIGSVGFQNPVPNGGSFSPMCFLDPSRFVYPYQTYRVPDNQSIFRGPPLPTFGNMGHFGPVTGFHASLPPCINNLSSPHQNVQVVSLVSQKKNKDDSTKEGIKSCEDPLNPEKERKKRRRAAETEVTNFLKKEAPGKGTKMDEEEDEDDEKIFVPAKRKRDEKGSRDKEKKEKPKEDKAEKMEDEGPA